MQAGHAIHEDEPARTAQVLLGFLQRFRVGEPKLPIPRPAGAGISLPVAAGPACGAAALHRSRPDRGGAGAGCAVRVGRNQQHAASNVLWRI